MAKKENTIFSFTDNEKNELYKKILHFYKTAEFLGLKIPDKLGEFLADKTEMLIRDISTLFNIINSKKSSNEEKRSAGKELRKYQHFVPARLRQFPTYRFYVENKF